MTPEQIDGLIKLITSIKTDVHYILLVVLILVFLRVLFETIKKRWLSL